MVSETPQFLQLCYELLAMYIIIKNTQKFLHFTEETTITTSVSTISVKQMRLHKTYELVTSKKTPLNNSAMAYN